MTVGCYQPTKKALKEKVGKSVWTARLEETSMFGSEITENGRFTVVGPDPYRNRKWFATVYTRDGIITKVE